MTDSRENGTPAHTRANVPYAPTDVRARISELDARILALEASLAAARGEREDLQSRLDDYKYPILTLPDEITADIFIAFLPGYPDCPPMSGLYSPALLGQICQNWREIAFDTPWLWRAIELYIWNEYSFEALTTWLSRSGSCSLSLSLSKSYEPTFSELPHFTDAIISHSARWERIRLNFTYARDLSWLVGSFPLLRHLSISPHIYETQSPPAIEPFGDAPQLTSVALGVNFNLSEVVLPWSQLTSISAERLTPAMAIDILRRATALVNLNSTLWAASATPGVVQPPALHLQSLTLRDGDNLLGPQQQLLDALTAPALRHLSISEHELNNEPISIIASFLSRSHCSLDSLHVTHSSLHEADYRAAFPSIRAIEVPIDSVDEIGEEDEEDSDNNEE
ncbi:hypothetical protein C8J57DRAFT_1185214 [Mycena rebaudengoi]|nr:hypothetical protein C8J57DRAFT_1185214 [Mycena rebaudengoi]